MRTRKVVPCLFKWTTYVKRNISRDTLWAVSSHTKPRLTHQNLFCVSCLTSLLTQQLEMGSAKTPQPPCSYTWTTVITCLSKGVFFFLGVAKVADTQDGQDAYSTGSMESLPIDPITAQIHPLWRFAVVLVWLLLPFHLLEAGRQFSDCLFRMITMDRFKLWSVASVFLACIHW